MLRESFRESVKKHGTSEPNLLNSTLIGENNLPAMLTFLERGKDAFFAAIISEVNGAAVNFKLAPTYTLYLVARHVYSPLYRPSLSSTERSRAITAITKRIATSIQQTIQVSISVLTFEYNKFHLFGTNMVHVMVYTSGLYLTSLLLYF